MKKSFRNIKKILEAMRAGNETEAYNASKEHLEITFREIIGKKDMFGKQY